MIRESILMGMIITSMLLIPDTLAADYSNVIVEFKDEISTSSALDMLRKYDLQVVDTLTILHGAILNIRTDQIEIVKNERYVKALYEEKFLSYTNSYSSNIELVGIKGIEEFRDAQGRNVTGEGVRVAVIDTGVDYTHKDLRGSGKVISGYDFLDRDDDPMDRDGHGTMIAGIIAADGENKGIAPKASIIAYRVASEDRYVSTIDMIRAMERAVEDNADIVNISLGLDYVNEEIDKAVNGLVEHGIVVVTAAGNNGEDGKKIGSPASAIGAISVGATLNNVTTPFFSTLKIEGKENRFDPLPMIDTVAIKESVKGRMVFANYATESDVKDLDLKGAIVLAERGGPSRIVDGKEVKELVYFSDKEFNVASKGAVALIVYNNQPGIFQGKLLHEYASPNYKPSIPVVSISREEGLILKEFAKSNLIAELKVFSEPDFVASFSSRGPVSAFYMKPDLVAPGVMINSTALNDSYRISSGTSFAAPHVAGAAALLLQMHPDLKPAEIASILATTADPIKDPSGDPYTFDVAGSGRLNITSALRSDIIAIPHYAVLHTSNGKEVGTIELRSIDHSLNILDVSVDMKDLHINTLVERINETTAKLFIKPEASIEGKFEGRIHVRSESSTISIPLIVYVEKVSINASNEDGRIWLKLDVPEAWKFAKVRIINPESNEKQLLTLTPSKNPSSIRATSIGEHWIEADVITESGEKKGFSMLYVNDISPDNVITYLGDGIPMKQILIITAFLGLVTIGAYVWLKKNN